MGLGPHSFFRCRFCQWSLASISNRVSPSASPSRSCLTSAFFMAGTNQIHRWAHEKAPNWVRFLQRHELILSPRRHAEHHRAPHDIHFCISCGWCNVFLDRIRFWHVLTDVLVFVGFPQAEESVMGTSRQRALAESGTSAAVRVSEA